ncbi:monooxygenase [Myriangium duriaei CBS 260.36]|uniref:Monooxygenase n=1 Tax=Myriangium duriaei CBS 260.36 TaxID=1168546 RepID=A0A9P4MHA0_9PEZI|nr:monooxygenase [Myriangium duriaei CBS 260.36]
MAELNVIIAGAGIAGLATAIALRRLEATGLTININLYEKATELREIGASIALSPNGLRTLERLGVNHALDDDLAFRGPSGLPMIYRHWKTNEIVSVDKFIDVADQRHQTARFHRGHLHQALLQHVPRDIIHLRKAVRSAKADGHGVEVSFEDGTSVKGDLLVGADGLRSKVRTTFNPDHHLHWTGRTFFRATFDTSLIESIPDLPPDSTHWWGPHHSFFASRLGKNQYTTVGNYDPTKFSKNQDPATVSWDQEGSADDIALFRQLYSDWNPVVKALAEATPQVRLYPNFAGRPLKSWVFGDRVTLVGDAAHTHGGAHAAGGSLALDDAWALYLSLSHVLTQAVGDRPSAPELHQALTIYEKTRRPHTTRLLEGVLASVGAVAPASDEALREKMKSRPSTTWLTEHDVEASFAEVVAKEDLSAIEEIAERSRL